MPFSALVARVGGFDKALIKPGSANGTELSCRRACRVKKVSGRLIQLMGFAGLNPLLTLAVRTSMAFYHLHLLSFSLQNYTWL